MNIQNLDKNTSSTLSNGTSQNPKSGVLGSHPIGAGLGAVGVGAAVGAVGGAVAGPVGAVAGAATGAVIGGLAGSAVAEVIDPAAEADFWRKNHSTRPYANSAFGYDQYAPAYRYGWECFGRGSHRETTFESMEAELGRGWDSARGTSRLGWDKAKAATQDAWNRVKTATHSQPTT
jgi:hypothetical protein